MQPYFANSQANTMDIASKKRGLNMGQAYSGPNLLDGGSVASFADPQMTTRQDYERQNQGQNLMTNVPGKTVEAARAADKAITESSDKTEEANMFNMIYKANIMEGPNMKSSATRQLADPATVRKVNNDVGISRLQHMA
jgi:hypothetical protein